MRGTHGWQHGYDFIQNVGVRCVPVAAGIFDAITAEGPYQKAMRVHMALE